MCITYLLFFPATPRTHMVALCTFQPPPAIPEEVKQWQKAKAEFDRQWGQLSAAIKGSAIDPLSVDCSVSPEEMLKSAVKQVEGVYLCTGMCELEFWSVYPAPFNMLLPTYIGIFEFKVMEFSSLEEDADIDDDPIIDEGELYVASYPNYSHHHIL